MAQKFLKMPGLPGAGIDFTPMKCSENNRHTGIVLYNKYACSTSPRGVGSGSYKGGAVAREGRGCGRRQVHQQLHRKTGCLDRHQRCFERLAMASFYWWGHCLRYACKPVAQHLVQNIQRCRCDAFENHVRLQFYTPRRKYILLYTVELSHAPVLFCLKSSSYRHHPHHTTHQCSSEGVSSSTVYNSMYLRRGG